MRVLKGGSEELDARGRPVLPDGFDDQRPQLGVGLTAIGFLKIRR
jgi:hypothetical protein